MSDLILSGSGIHNNKVSDIFELTPQDTFVIGVSGESRLDALVLYRVKADGSLSASFWYELFQMEQNNMTITEFIYAALSYFTSAVQRYFSDSAEQDDIYDQLANALSTIRWDAENRKFNTQD